MHLVPKGFMLEAITQKVDSSAVRHPNGEKVAGSFADRPPVQSNIKYEVEESQYELNAC